MNSRGSTLLGVVTRTTPTSSPPCPCIMGALDCLRRVHLTSLHQPPVLYEATSRYWVPSSPDDWTVARHSTSVNVPFSIPVVLLRCCRERRSASGKACKGAMMAHWKSSATTPARPGGSPMLQVRSGRHASGQWEGATSVACPHPIYFRREWSLDGDR